MKPSIRAWLLRLHRWTGMTAGLVLTLSAVTGALMVFRPQIEPAIDARLLSVPSCVGHATIDDMTAKAAAAYPSGTPDFIRLRAGSDAALELPSAWVRFTDKQTVYLNPCTGEVLGMRNRYAGPFGSIEGLHRLRFIEGGGVIAGSAALMALIVLIGGGLWMWWPATCKGVRGATRFAGGMTGGARMLSLHKSVGVWAAIAIAFSAMTGLPQAFKWYRQALYAVTGSPLKEAEPRSAPAPGAARLPLEAAWERARAMMPDAVELQIRYPVKPRDAVEIFMIGADAPHPNARTYLHLDAYSGKVLAFRPYHASSTGNRLYFWMLSAHNGMVGGALGQLLLFLGCLAVPVLAYTGIGTFVRRTLMSGGRQRLTVRVARKQREARGIHSFELVDLSGKPLPPFAAGAHIDVYLRAGLVRQYSLCNRPGETHRYLIAVQRAANSRGGSRAMHDEVHQGDVIEISAPRNHFPLAAGAQRTLLLAGGIGVTPIIAMAEQLAADGADFEMHYCARTAERTAFFARIRDSAFASRVHFHFSDGAPDQLIDIPGLLRYRHPDGTHLYVCGPSGFMDVAIDTARRLGWPDSSLHREYFAAEVAAREGDAEFEVKLARSGQVIRIAPDQTVLAALRESGVDVPHSCEQGVCGTCATRVLEGEPDHRDLCLSAEERMKNMLFMPCCSRAKGMLVLDI